MVGTNEARGAPGGVQVLGFSLYKASLLSQFLIANLVSVIMIIIRELSLMFSTVYFSKVELY